MAAEDVNPERRELAARDVHRLHQAVRHYVERGARLATERTTGVSEETTKTMANVLDGASPPPYVLHLARLLREAGLRLTYEPVAEPADQEVEVEVAVDPHRQALEAAVESLDHAVQLISRMRDVHIERLANRLATGLRPPLDSAVGRRVIAEELRRLLDERAAPRP